MRGKDLERDLYRTSWVWDDMESSPTLAKELYQTLCNHRFRHETMTTEDEPWACTWRYAGEIASTLHDPNETYLDYYCSGLEGEISPTIEELLAELGWTVVDEPEDVW